VHDASRMRDREL